MKLKSNLRPLVKVSSIEFVMPKNSLLQLISNSLAHGQRNFYALGLLALNHQNFPRDTFAHHESFQTTWKISMSLVLLSLIVQQCNALKLAIYAAHFTY